MTMRRYRCGLVVVTIWCLTAAQADLWRNAAVVSKPATRPAASRSGAPSAGRDRPASVAPRAAGESRRLPRPWCRALFLLSCVNPAAAVLRNDYSGALWPMIRHDKETTAAFRVIYHGVFSFLRLRPRLLFVVGSTLRALQCSTSLSRLIDPSVGVGLGLNLSALAACARWPSPLVLGWASSRRFWTFLGAEPPRGGHVPITVHLSDPRDKAARASKESYFRRFFEILEMAF